MGENHLSSIEAKEAYPSSLRCLGGGLPTHHTDFQKWVMEEEFVFAWLLDSIASE